MKKSKFAYVVAVAFAVSLAAAQGVKAQTVFSFNNGDGNDQYTDGENWDQGAVPDLTTTDTALIDDGSAVIYTPGGDLTIKNGGELEIENGSFEQTTGTNYIQLNGNGTILINGGTFLQGTVTSTPFNVTGTGNMFTITSGTATLDTNFSDNVGLTFSQSGGTFNAGNEFDFNNSTSTLSGGTINTGEITGVNGGADVFTIMGGLLNLTASKDDGMYGGGTTQYINFTLGSTGEIYFDNTADTLAFVNGKLTSGAIEYNGTIDPGAFDVSQTANGITVTLSTTPEPTTYVLMSVGLLLVLGIRKRFATQV